MIENPYDPNLYDQEEMPIFIPAWLYDAAKIEGIALPEHWVRTESLLLAPTPKATTEGVAAVLKKIWSQP